MNPPTDSTRPLDGLRVLDLTRMHPGGFCTLLLADLGADVVKVEAPGFGDGLRFMGEEFPAAHVALNRGKRSMTLNLKSPDAPELLRRLARRADVLVESHRPGALEAQGLGFADLRQENPGLVWCSLSGFGSDGPNVDAPGHDLTYLGYSGILSTLTVGEQPPVPTSTISLPFAGLMGAFGILAALSGRERTGAGARVDANMVDTMTWTLSEDLVRAANSPGSGWGSFAARANYRCSDGRWVTCTATEPPRWALLVAALGLPELADHQLGVDEGAAAGRLAEAFATRPSTHWLEQPGLAGGVGPVHEPAELLDDPQVVHREGLVRTEGGGPFVLTTPLRIDRASGGHGSHAMGPAPSLGQHTDAVLADAGYGPDEIAALHDQGTV